MLRSEFRKSESEARGLSEEFVAKVESFLESRSNEVFRVHDLIVALFPGYSKMGDAEGGRVGNAVICALSILVKRGAVEEFFSEAYLTSYYGIKL